MGKEQEVIKAEKEYNKELRPEQGVQERAEVEERKKLRVDLKGTSFSMVGCNY